MLLLPSAAQPDVCLQVLNVHVPPPPQKKITGYLDLCSSIAELAMCPPSRLKFWEGCLE